MNMTSTAVMTTQIVDAAISRSWFLGTDLHLLQLATRPVMDDVRDLRRPHEAVTRLVTGACGVDDRLDDLLRELVLDDEDQQRLRQEPRLEHPPAVLVRDAALPAVADRLDDRDTDVPRRLLDGVDDRLHPVSHHHRFYLHHPFLPCALENDKKPRRHAHACFRGLDASAGRLQR